MATVADVDLVALLPPGTWELDPTRSRVGFEVRHLKVMHLRGCFHEVAAMIGSDERGAASISASLVVASIDTGDARRDARLLSEAFFDSEHHPTMDFIGVAPPVVRREPLTVAGSLTLCGITKSLALRTDPVQLAAGGGEARIHATGAVSRRDFGLDWDPAFAAGGLAIDDLVKLAFDVALVRRTGSL